MFGALILDRRRGRRHGRSDAPTRLLSTCERLASVDEELPEWFEPLHPGAQEAGSVARAGTGCQAAYRRRNQSTVRLTAAWCGVGSNGPNAAWNFEASETKGRSN
jgi:hypothetical protein